MAKPKDRWSSKGIIKDSDFAPGEQYFVEDYAAETAGSAWGIVAPYATGKRKPPPNPRCFQTEKSWFDRGHLMALELGGSDSKANLVPQCTHQNEHGSWRRQEEQVKLYAMQQWSKKRYVYFGAEAVYEPKDGEAFYSKVPNKITMTCLSFGAKDVGKVKEHLKDIKPGTAASALSALGVATESHTTNKPFTNGLTAEDLVLVHKDITTSNRDHAVNYWTGKVLVEFENGYGKDAAREALQIRFDTAGRKLNAAQQKQVEVWRHVYQSARSSPELSEEAIIATDPEAAANAAKVRNAFAQGQLDKIRGETAMDIPEIHHGKQDFITKATKSGPRRRESISLDHPLPKAGDDLVRLEAAIEEVKKGAKPLADQAEEGGPAKKKLKGA